MRDYFAAAVVVSVSTATKMDNNWRSLLGSNYNPGYAGGYDDAIWGGVGFGGGGSYNGLTVFDSASSYYSDASSYYSDGPGYNGPGYISVSSYEGLQPESSEDGFDSHHSQGPLLHQHTYYEDVTVIEEVPYTDYETTYDVEYDIVPEVRSR